MTLIFCSVFRRPPVARRQAIRIDRQIGQGVPTHLAEECTYGSGQKALQTARQCCAAALAIADALDYRKVWFCWADDGTQPDQASGLRQGEPAGSTADGLEVARARQVIGNFLSCVRETR